MPANPQANPHKHLCGWLGPDHIQQGIAQRYGRLRSLAPRLFAASAPTVHILLYKAWRDALGDYPKYVAQEIGDCVSFAHGHANDLLQCVEIGLGNPTQFRETDTEFLYGESRKIAGILGNADGSYGAAAVKAMMEVGMVSREMLGPDGVYDGTRAKEWGRIGPPATLEAEAAAFKLGGGARVSDWDELVASISNGYPVTIACDQGFETERDAQGFCRRHGTWGHCMLIAGVRLDRKGALVCQSWGDQAPTGPTDLDQPLFSFWVEDHDVQSILAQGDSWALSKTTAFVERPLPASWKYSDLA